MFCCCFVYVDSLWTNKNAVRTQFGAIIGEVKTMLKDVLSQDPQTLEMFKNIAAHSGMAVV